MVDWDFTRMPEGESIKKMVSSLESGKWRALPPHLLSFDTYRIYGDVYFPKAEEELYINQKIYTDFFPHLIETEQKIYKLYPTHSNADMPPQRRFKNWIFQIKSSEKCPIYVTGGVVEIPLYIFINTHGFSQIYEKDTFIIKR